MEEVSLSLLVLKTNQVERLLAFYRAIGIQFEEERHGNGPLHYAATMGCTVLELYPAAAADTDAVGIRVGFRVPNVLSAVESLRAGGAVIVSTPTASEWGSRAVVRDPDGRAVELYAR